MSDNNYKRASVVIIGIAGLLFLVSQIATRIFWNHLDYREFLPFQWWFGPINSLVMPILAGWVGILLRKRYPKPSLWTKGLVLAFIPATYLLWSIGNSNYFMWTGARCQMLYCGILGFMLPPERLEAAGKDRGWLHLTFFLASAFLYVGICRVINHFSVSSFQMLSSEWTRLFVRAMRFIPLAMAICFLAGFSFSAMGQRAGEIKALGIAVQSAASVMFIVSAANVFTRFYGSVYLYRLYCLLVQPACVYLMVVLCRVLRSGIRGKGLMKDLFHM